MFKRQLVGFYLMRGIKDSHLRFPVEALNRLASILYSGNFSKEEDEAILAWVEEHGPNNWTGLAGSLGRNYIHGPASVFNRLIFNCSINTVHWMIYSYCRLSIQNCAYCLYLNDLTRHQHLKERREGKKGKSSKFVRNSDISDDIKLMEEVLKQDPEALSKMTPTGVGWAEVADSLSRPRDAVYRDWVNRILPTLRRHRAGNH